MQIKIITDWVIHRKFLAGLMALLITAIISAGTIVGASDSTIDNAGTANVEEESRLDFSLPVPQSLYHQKYLGVSGSDFMVKQIKAEIVIIEIFSMYCPICQREAVNVNRLFELIEKKSELKQRVKLIGIGAGNSDFEVDFFKKKYRILFPLFSDATFALHKKIGQVRTPHFFGLKLEDNNRFNVFYSTSGNISDPEKFLETILKKAEQVNKK